MREPALNSSHFPTAFCDACGKSVLTYLTFDNAGEARRFCVHCDRSIVSELRWVTVAELESDGYQIGAPAPRKGGCGCGSGGSCSVRRQ